MNQPSPAIVAQSAVRRLPRWALLLLCAAYLLPGFLFRLPWKNADVASFGFMGELARGTAGWLAPSLLGERPEVEALLPYWLGAWAMRAGSGWLAPDVAARIPFMALLALTMLATWYAVYALARSPQAQPVAFAFGGEARPKDYARAIADGGLLALVACLGLAQLSHETTPALAQLAFAASALYGAAVLRLRFPRAIGALAVGGAGLVLSGAPFLALWMVAAAALHLLPGSEPHRTNPREMLRIALPVATIVLACAALATLVGAWNWHIPFAEGGVRPWDSVARLLLWFTWPAWPLAMWTLWRWRRQLWSIHVLLPLCFFAAALVAAVATQTSDRALLLGLPALAALSAFALPTLTRSVAALIDWFTLLFFSICAIVVWLFWSSMHLHVPPNLLRTVTRALPGFVPDFSAGALLVALAATGAWAWVVWWRARAHRPAVWRSLVLPAAGATLNWVLLTTLWLPILNYARSYQPLVRDVARQIERGSCVETYGLSQSQIAALRHHGGLDLRRAGSLAACRWLLVDRKDVPTLPGQVDMDQWMLRVEIPRPGDIGEVLVLYRRRPEGR